jgi:hypothetical protein
VATYVPAKRATAFRTWVSLVDRAARPSFKSSATLAAGDVKVSKDGGALTNLTTLPVVTPAAGPIIQVDLSATEMTCDIATVVFQDAAGAEWDDLMLVIPTAARQIDDLTFPNTSGRGMDVDAAGGVEVGSFQAGAITAAAFTAGAIDAAAIATDAIGSAELAQAAVDKIVNSVWDELTTEGRVASSYGQKLKDLVLTAAGRVDVGLWLGAAPDALSTGKVAADVKLWLASAPNALVAGDVPANVRAFLAGSIVAAAFAVDAIDSVALAPSATAEIVDRLLGRSISGGADGGRTVTSALRRIRNRIAIAAGVLTTYQEDDVAVDHTAAVTTTAGDPISQIDPV